MVEKTDGNGHYSQIANSANRTRTKTKTKANSRAIRNQTVVEAVAISRKVYWILKMRHDDKQEKNKLIIPQPGLNFLEQKTGHTLNQEESDAITSGAKSAFQKFTGSVLPKIPVPTRALWIWGKANNALYSKSANSSW